MAQSLSGSQLTVDNDVIGYMANSLKYDLGNPERKVDPQVVGNGAVFNVVSEDISTQKSKVMFDLKSTTENELLVSTWNTNSDANVIKVISPEGVARVFESAALINKPEFDTGADGVISIEFESNPLVRG